MLATCNFAPTCPQLKTMHPSTTGLSPSQFQLQLSIQPDRSSFPCQLVFQHTGTDFSRASKISFLKNNQPSCTPLLFRTASQGTRPTSLLNRSKSVLQKSKGHGFPRKIPVAEGVDHVILCYKYLLSSKPRDFDPFIQFRLEKKYISGPFKSRRGRRTPAKW
ncbi:hypothetical protein AV530_010012 [Patagioenas fasciata monilis]|uniref:Uncharacterized protein n=1 Tax=Patagioenas fasciata monilis TaxID=372326 RepID=A0A1V4KAU7_PATFA|nr:hypothetical protein AV530_010012 [Patagioenas fasciata monilis]